jgi:hypothetical protein
MTEDISPEQIGIPSKPPRKLPRWLYVVIPIAFIGICCIIVALVLPSIFKVKMKSGGYSVDKVILSSNLQDNQPVDIRNEFKPSDTIICTVKTTGVDGVITMRWYLLIFDI